MKHIIDKSFSFCYGHRVHNQRLDTNFTESGDACLACRHLHGHEGLIKIFLEEIKTGENVTATGMVTDFKHLGWAKNFIDDVLDHKMILDFQDPLLPAEVSEIWRDDKIGDEYLIRDTRGFATVALAQLVDDLKLDLDLPHHKALYEKYEGLVFVDFVPTSENLAGWLGTVAAEKMKGIPNVRVAAVEYWETPKSHCRVEF
jgi:6-pyruvoyltetrahydropterin/6-carboxytetrahydropterin synthase